MTNCSRFTKRLHIAVLVFGAAVFAACAFNTNIWFDECYSVAAVSGDLSSLVPVLTDDVHPFLYYFLLKPVYHLGGGSLIVMRLFSALAMWLLALAGYTHVRAHISEKAGLFFSLFCVISPASIKYAGEIRMYSFGALFIFFSAFYAYLALRSDERRVRNLSLFVAFSVAAAYTHYYGLVTVCIINAFFIVGALVKKLRAKSVILPCAAELLLYIPGFIVFLTQSTRVASGDYWIRVEYPDVLFQTFSYILTGGDSPWDCYMTPRAYSVVALFSCVLFAAAIFAVIRGLLKRDDAARPAALALGVFCSVVGAGLAVSVFKEFYYVRYTMLCHGLILVALAYAASRINRRAVSCALCVLLAAASITVCRPFFGAMHNGDFACATDDLHGAISDDDVLILESITPGAVLSYMLDGHEKYFINEDIDEYPRAYTAFADEFSTVASLESISERLDDIDGRVWILEKNDGDGILASEIERIFPDAVRTDELTLTILYRHNTFRLAAYTLDGNDR